jgi:hypothetical protein
MLSEINLDEIRDDAVQWKLRYKRLVTNAYAIFANEEKIDWRVVGVPDNRVRIFSNDDRAFKAQGIVYCHAKRLAALWKDLNFERRVSTWGDLFVGPHCDCVVETYHSRTLGLLSVSRQKPPNQTQYKLHWVREDPASLTWVILIHNCKYRMAASPTLAEPQWTAAYICGSLDPDPQYGNRCYVRIMTWNESVAINNHLLEQLARCESFCRDDAKWESVYSVEAMRATDLELRK